MRKFLNFKFFKFKALKNLMRRDKGEMKSSSATFD